MWRQTSGRRVCHNRAGPRKTGRIHGESAGRGLLQLCPCRGGPAERRPGLKRGLLESCAGVSALVRRQPRPSCGRRLSLAHARLGLPAPHTGPAVELVGIATTLIFLAGFLVARGCWLFPCLCAPEVPGWLFFPPHDPPPNPLKGQIIDLYGFRVFLDKLANGFAMPDDCVWEPVR